MQTAFDVFRSQTPVYLVEGGELCQCASMAVKVLPVFTIFIPFSRIYVHTCIYVHIHTYTYIYVSIHTYTNIYIHICSNLYLNMLHQIEVWRCFGAEAADILWLLGVTQSARFPVIGHGSESTSSVMGLGASLRIQAGAVEAKEACLAGWCQKLGLQKCCL